MKLLSTVAIVSACLGYSEFAFAGSPDAYHSNDYLAMVEPDTKPQSGQLTAGDYDDVLNPDLYKTYADKMLQGQLSGKNLPYVDANNRIDVRVVDNSGQGFPFAAISVKSPNSQENLTLKTAANGMSYLYPKYDSLEPGDVLSVSTNDNLDSAKTLTQDLIANGGEIIFDMPVTVSPIDKLDLLLTIDTTGSMGDEMDYLQAELSSIVNRVVRKNPDINIRHGLIVYRDIGDDYVFKTYPFNDSLEDFKILLEAQEAHGGGDAPEAMHTAMQKSLEFEWRDKALKVNFLVADAPPHDAHIAKTWDSGSSSRSKGIHIIPIAGSGVDKTAEFLMRSMAQFTNGRYVFLTDDSGVGNAHAEPTVDCYVVTRLDGLMSRILNSLISGKRHEPKVHDIIRSVGNYNAGKCEVAQPSLEATQNRPNLPGDAGFDETR